MGEVPDWYLVIRAARYMNVPPWELAGQSTAWRDMALASESAELQAEAKETEKWTSQMPGKQPHFPRR